MGKTIFSKIIAGEIPADIVHEDDLVVAFRDVSPQAPVHILIVPREVIPGVDFLEERHRELVGHMLLTAKKLAHSEKLDEGYRLVINSGEKGGQTVDHLHLHLLGGRSMQWPPG